MTTAGLTHAERGNRRGREVERKGYERHSQGHPHHPLTLPRWSATRRPGRLADDDAQTRTHHDGTPTSTENTWIEDRHHITLAEFWDVLATYPLDPIELANALPHPNSGLPNSELGPVWELKARAEPLSDLRVDAGLVEVVTWGITRQVITVDEGAMLVAAYPSRRGGPG